VRHPPIRRPTATTKHRFQHPLPSSTANISATAGIEVDGGTVGGGGKMYRNSSKRLSPTTAGNFIDDSSTTLSSPERQSTVNIVNVNLPRQLFIRHYETTYRQRQLRSTTFSSFHRFVIHRRTADLQKRQRSSTVYDDLSDK